MSDTDRHTVTYEQAAQILGVSVRTIQRRVRGGQLTTVADNGRQLVVLPESEVLTPTSEPEASSMAESQIHRYDLPPDPRIAALEARVAELEEDRDTWRTLAARLSDTVTEQNRMLAAQIMQQGRMIASEAPVERQEHAHEVSTPPRPRWSLRRIYRAWRGRM